MNVPVPPLFRSKKFWAAVIASLLSFVGLVRGMSLEQIAIVTAPLYVFIPSQGVADIGKEKAKVEKAQSTT